MNRKSLRSVMKVFETFIGQWGLVLPVKLVIEEVLIKWSQNLHVFTVFAIFRILDFIQICGEKSLWQSFGTLKYELTVSKDFPSASSWCSPFFSLDAVFMKKFVKQNKHFYNFWGKMKKATIERQISSPKKLSWIFLFEPIILSCPKGTFCTQKL